MQEKIYGYSITRIEGSDGESSHAYTLVKGERWIGLFRNKVNPSLLFAINLGNFTRSGAIKGRSWFTDEGGKLRATDPPKPEGQSAT